jgi:hypothetical protein
MPINYWRIHNSWVERWPFARVGERWEEWFLQPDYLICAKFCKNKKAVMSSGKVVVGKGLEKEGLGVGKVTWPPGEWRTMPYESEGTGMALFTFGCPV